MKVKDFIGKRLRLARNHNGISMQELAESVSLTPSNICKYENNKLQPSMDFVKEISSIFSVPTAYFTDPYFPESVLLEVSNKKKALENLILSIDRIPFNLFESQEDKLFKVLTECKKAVEEKMSIINQGLRNE